jgi:hypothetical protein
LQNHIVAAKTHFKVKPGEISQKERVQSNGDVDHQDYPPGSIGIVSF